MATAALHDDDEEVDVEAEAAAAELMASVHRGFAKAKLAGIPAAKRLMKELQAACASSAGYEIRLIQDSLQNWEVSLFDWAFDEDAPLHKDLQKLSELKDDLVPLVVRIKFPDDFPFAPPLVYCASPLLASQYIFDGALCMEMLVDWQPTYGNVEALLVQVAAFLAHSNTRVASLCSEEERKAAAGGAGVQVDGRGAGAGGGGGGAAAAAGAVQPPPQPQPLAAAQPQQQQQQQPPQQQPPPQQQQQQPPPVLPPAPPPPAAAIDVTDAGVAEAGTAAFSSTAASPADEELQARAQAAYEALKRFHAKKGWAARQPGDA